MPTIDDVTQRDILLATLAPDQHIIQMVGILTLCFRRPDDHWQQIGSFTI